MRDREWHSRRPGRNRDDRGKGFPSHGSQRSFQPRRREQVREQERPRRDLTPQPIDGKCNPLCPFFWCGRRAYQVRRDPRTGRKYVFCTWIGDECIGASCQYASCKLNYMLPDGSCAYARQASVRKEKDMMEELAGEEMDFRTREMLSRRLGKKRLEDLY